MNTHANRLRLMSASAAVMALAGLAGSFGPQEILSAAGAPPSAAGALLVQLTGALYLAFAMVNWMGRTNLIGGVYARPVATGNTVHFTVGALALLKGVGAGNMAAPFLFLAGIYALLAIAFAIILFTHPATGPS